MNPSTIQLRVWLHISPRITYTKYERIYSIVRIVNVKDFLIQLIPNFTVHIPNIVYVSIHYYWNYRMDCQCYTVILTVSSAQNTSSWTHFSSYRAWQREMTNDSFWSETNKPCQMKTWMRLGRFHSPWDEMLRGPSCMEISDPVSDVASHIMGLSSKIELPCIGTSWPEFHRHLTASWVLQRRALHTDVFEHR